MQQEAFLSFQERPGLGWLRDTWSISREGPPEAKEELGGGGGLMKGRIHGVAFPEAHFPPRGGMRPLPPEALPSPPCAFFKFSRKVCCVYPECLLEARRPAFRS